jgi:hypothetical protein
LETLGFGFAFSGLPALAVNETYVNEPGKLFLGLMASPSFLSQLFFL